MRRMMIAATLCLGFFADMLPAQASSSWTESRLSLTDALSTGFVVVSTHYNSEGHLIFVLQRQHILLMCRFHEEQTQKCAQLGNE